MKSIKLLSILGLAAGLSLMQAQASIEITYQQPSNSGNAIPGWLQSCVDNYNTVNAPNPLLPDPTTGAGQDTTTQNGNTTVVLGNSLYGAYDYIVLHFGGGSGHDGYDAFFIGGDTGDLTFIGNTWVNNGGHTVVNGLSWFEFFGPTPDNSTTSVPEPSTIVAGALLLLPFGVSTLRILRKKIVA